MFFFLIIFSCNWVHHPNSEEENLKEFTRFWLVNYFPLISRTHEQVRFLLHFCLPPPPYFMEHGKNCMWIQHQVPSNHFFIRARVFPRLPQLKLFTISPYSCFFFSLTDWVSTTSSWRRQHKKSYWKNSNLLAKVKKLQAAHFPPNGGTILH